MKTALVMLSVPFFTGRIEADAQADKTIEMKLMYVYIVECADKSYYTGVTNNVEKRVGQHNDGINSECYTYRKRPVKLVFYEMFPNPSQAIAFEKQVKRWTRKKKEALINER